MKSLDILTVNFWLNLQASNVRYRMFVKDIIARIILSGIPELTALLVDTDAIVDLYSDEIDLRASNMTAQRISTFMKNKVLSDYQTEVRGLQGAVIDVFTGKNSMQYTVEVFPNKLAEYSEMNEFTADALFARTKAFTNKYVIELGAPRKLAFATLASDYTTSHATQKTAMAAIDKSNIDIKLKVKDVKDIMFRNILKVAAHFYLTPEVVKTFYNEAFLYCRHKNKNGEPIEAAYKSKVAKSSVLLADISYTTAERMLFENLGNGSLYYFSSDDLLGDIIVPDDAIELIEGEELIVLTSTLKKYLYIANKSQTVGGMIQLSMI